MSITEKIAVLLVTQDAAKKESLSDAIKKHVSTPAIIYMAQDGVDGESKLRNVPPDLLITDYELTRVRGRNLIDDVLADKAYAACAIIIIDHLPKEEIYLEELATGRVQFMGDWSNAEALSHCLARALNYSSHGEKSTFHLRYLAKGDQLIAMGERADFVYILKKGQLRAYREAGGEKITLGEIHAGEFVGEMAYINGEPRNANVEALSECELVEIPLGTLETILYQRPLWARTLLQTLSKRLRHANESRTTS